MADSPDNGRATSPAAAGPAGPGFEVKLGAYYLLALLAQSAPHAIPGTVTVKVAFQRAREGFPLDDTIVHAERSDGRPATLQIQAKRSITFAPRDPVFKDVVAQIADAIRQPGFWDNDNQLAIATPRTTTNIAGAYQDVIKWAHGMGSHEEFFARLARPGAANPEMRTFVDTFRVNLAEAGAPNDEATVWRILRRFHILTLDFNNTASLAEGFAVDHARMLLPAERAADAAALWSALIAIALDKAATGGDLDFAALTEELVKKGIRAGDDRALAPVFAAVQSEARLALDDIGTRIGATSLARHEHVAKVRNARANARFVVVRGTAGVGKSGILKHTAEQDAQDAPVLVLSPGRIAAGGFLAHCRRLGYMGTPEDFLRRLAATGSTTVFIDNLDRFTDEERVTVKDVLRLASRIAGISVVATARTSTAKPDDEWLPGEAVASLGGETTVLIQELSEADLQELRAAEPHLRPLLADNHPAKSVTRNLFRLSRIARLPAGEDVPQTELGMVTQWWTTADGPEPGRRERQRILRKIAEATIRGHDIADVSEQDGASVDALVRSESLIDRGADRVVLRHDVLREWAAASRIIDEHSLIDTLPLVRPASPLLSRAIELVARAALEQNSASPTWQDLLDRVSAPTHHPSWRRAVLLAIVNSEAAGSLLTRQSSSLLANNGRLLCEITRAVRAVNVVPGEDALRKIVPEGTSIPKGFFIPHGRAWSGLLSWLLANFDAIPAAAIKDVVDLFWDWEIGTFAQGPVGPHIVDRIYPLLRSITLGEPDDLPRGHRRALTQTIKMLFLTLCPGRPELAEDYISILARDPERSLQSIVNEIGNLPAAAPQPYADLLHAALITSTKRRRSSSYEDEVDGAFSYVNSYFYPPAQKSKPFDELLAKAPAIGLALIRVLVAHAVTTLSRGKSPGDDGIILTIDGAERFFPWMTTYRWAREEGPNVVAAALAALRSWAIARVEKGDPIEAVLTDVVGPSGTCAAFVLVAIDVLRCMKTFPLSAAVPFVGSPELLTLERRYAVLDQVGLPRTTLHTRAAAFNPQSLPLLEYLLHSYSLPENVGPREMLKTQLQSAVRRLGPPDADSDFGDPRLMAVLAINRINPDNWSAHPENPSARVYTSPPEEVQREKALQATVNVKETRDLTVHSQLGTAVASPERVTPAFARAIADWIADADAAADASRTYPDQQDRLRAAFLVVRHGAEDTLAKYGKWAIDTLSAALSEAHERFGPPRQLGYNSLGLVFAGLFVAHKRKPSKDLIESLIRLAASQPFDASVGAHAVADDIAALDPRLSTALVRTAFVAAIKARTSYSFDEDDEKKQAAAVAERAAALDTHVASELAWLNENAAEPAWPPFPVQQARKRRGLRLPSLDGSVIEDPPPPEPPRIFADERLAAVWLGVLRPLGRGPQSSEVVRVVESYLPYTMARNGAGLEKHAEVEGNLQGDWNEAYYRLVADLVAILGPEQIDAFCKSITDLPDRSFLDVSPNVLNPLQTLYFSGQPLDAPLLKIRSAFAERLFATGQWRDHVRRSSGGIETHLGYAIPPHLFGYYAIGGHSGSVLAPDNIDRLIPLLPSASVIVAKGPTLYVASLALSLLEVKADARLLPFAVEMAEALLSAYPNDTALWTDYNVGQRWCRWLNAVLAADPSAFLPGAPLMVRLHAVLGRLANVGIPEAAALEGKLPT